jgi:hypothetical protein
VLVVKTWRSGAHVRDVYITGFDALFVMNDLWLNYRPPSGGYADPYHNELPLGTFSPDDEFNTESVAEEILDHLHDPSRDSKYAWLDPRADFYSRIQIIIKAHLDNEHWRRLHWMSTDNYAKGMRLLERLPVLIDQNTSIDQTRKQNILQAIERLYQVYENNHYYGGIADIQRVENRRQMKERLEKKEQNGDRLPGEHAPDPQGPEPEGTQSEEDETKLNKILEEIESHTDEAGALEDSLIEQIRGLDRVKDADQDKENKNVLCVLTEIQDYYVNKYLNVEENKARNEGLIKRIGGIVHTFNQQHESRHNALSATLASVDRFLDLCIDTSI